MSDLAKFFSEFESAIDGVEPGSIAGDTVLTSLPVWDSLALLSVMAMADSTYGVIVSGPELRACKTVTDVYALIQGKRG